MLGHVRGRVAEARAQLDLQRGQLWRSPRQTPDLVAGRCHPGGERTTDPGRCASNEYVHVWAKLGRRAENRRVGGEHTSPVMEGRRHDTAGSSTPPLPADRPPTGVYILIAHRANAPSPPCRLLERDAAGGL